MSPRYDKQCPPHMTPPRALGLVKLVQDGLCVPDFCTHTLIVWFEDDPHADSAVRIQSFYESNVQDFSTCSAHSHASAAQLHQRSIPG